VHFRVFEVNASHLIELVFAEHDKLLTIHWLGLSR